MKKLIFILFLTLGICSAAGAQTRFDTLSFAEAKTLAAKSNKLVFVDIYTAWCGPCREMTKKVFPRKDVGEFMNTHFISVKYDGEQDADGRALVEKYAVQSVPIYFVFDASGKLIGKAVGGMTAELFLEKMAGIIAPPEK